MAEANISVDQDQFTCPVCLDLLKDPVTIPCGHSYCMSCISDCWDQEDQKGIYRCPLCKQTFTPRPVLGKNGMIAEMVEKLKKTRLQAAAPAVPHTGSGDVLCDSCTENKQKAVKSCLECRSSYCQNHLEQHESLFRSKGHNLMDATVPPPAPAVPHTGSGDVLCDSCSGRKQKAVKSCLECQSSYCQNHLEQHESLFRGKGHNLMDATVPPAPAVPQTGSGDVQCDSCTENKQKAVKSCLECRSSYCQNHLEQHESLFRGKGHNLMDATVPPAPAVPQTGSGDVLCDSCSGRKQKAVKSCLECRGSYCQNHLEQHESLFRGKGHNLMDATGQLQEMICSRHGKLLEIYCRTEQRCICAVCLVDEHKHHDTVSTTAARTEKQRHLEEMQTEHQKTILKNEKDIQQLREAVASYKRTTQTAVEDSERIFTELIRSIERHRSEVTQLIRDQERAAVSRVEEQLEHLEQEIDDLRRRNAELKQLSDTHDHVHFLHTVKNMKLKKSLSVTLHGSTDGFTVSSCMSFDDVVKSVTQLRDKLQKFCSEETEKIPGTVKTIQVILAPEYPTREKFLQYFHQFTVDPNTVHSRIYPSEGNTVITSGSSCYSYPDHPDRFGHWFQAMCVESVTGRCYWEVEWSGDEVGISVAYKSIRRRERFGCNDQSWRLYCSKSICSFWYNDIKTKLPVVSSRRIGVYVDHSAGILSFYSVSDTMSLIHRVQTTFTQPLYPAIALGYHATAKLSCPTM